MESIYADEDDFGFESDDDDNSDDSSGDERECGDVEVLRNRPTLERGSSFRSSTNDKFNSQLAASVLNTKDIIIRDCRLSMSNIDELLECYFDSKKSVLDIAGCTCATAGISKIVLSLVKNADYLLMLNLNGVVSGALCSDALGILQLCFKINMS